MKQKHTTRPKLRLILFVVSLSLFLAFLIRYSLTYGRLPYIELNIRWLIIIAALSLAVFSALVSFYEYRGIGSQEGIIRRTHVGPYVSLTFDDGPSPRYTAPILDILKEYSIKATFFVVGKQAKKYPEIIKRMVSEGHDICNHTYSHRDLVPAKRATIIKEVTKTEKALKNIAGVESNLFRPPRGIYNQTVRKLLVDMNYQIILWSLSTCDWRMKSANGILKRVKRFVKEGSIILFHDSGAILKKEGGSRNSTVKSLPNVIEYLQGKGFEIIPITEMISISEIKPEPEIEPAEV